MLFESALDTNRQFSAGRSLRRTLGVWLANFFPFTLLAILIHLPILIWLGYILSGELEQRSILLFAGGSVFAALFLTNILTGTIIFGVIEQLRNRPVSLGRSLAVGASRILPVIGVGICVGLAVAGGTLLLVIPGLIVGSMLWVSTAVAVVERPGVFASMRRSRVLTNGYRWQLFGMICLFNLLDRGSDKVMEHWLLSQPTPGSVKLYLSITVGVSILMATVQAVAQAVVYHDLRLDLEGVDTDELANIFQ